MTRMRMLLSGGAASLALVAGGSLPAATQALRVHLSHGRTIDVRDCKIEDSRATLTLLGGGTIAFPSSLVSRIDEIAPEPEEIAAEVKEAPEPLSVETGRMNAGQAERAATPASGQVTKDETIDALIRLAAQRHHLEPELLAAVIAVESGYRAGAVSPRGAQGLMQLMPGTAKDLAVTDPFDAKQNIDAGARYLRRLLDQHGDSYVKALAAYNAGPGRVARYNGLPPYRETVNYIGRVLKRYRSPQPPPEAASSRR